MVHVVLTSPAGNGSPRFPFEGHLGLTPLVVKGVVQTRIDSDRKQMQAYDLTVHVRCYESRLSRFGPTQSNILADHVVSLWRSPVHPRPAYLGESESNFTIIVPVDSPGHSTAHFPDYRVFWRVEAAINHPHITGVGTRSIKSADLAILRYASRIPPPVSPQIPYLLVVPTSSKPRAPVLHYRVTTPETPIGPLDVVSISVTVQSDDQSLSIRSASLIVERRIELRDAAYPHSASASNTSTPTTESAPPSHSRSHLLPSSPAESPEPSTKTLVSIVAGTESGHGRFVRDPRGAWTRTLALQWPAAKSTARWAMGETLATDMARVAFYAKIKLVVTSSFGTDSVELRETPLAIVATNEAERRIALSKFAAYPPGLQQSHNPQSLTAPASAPPVAKIPANAMGRPSVHELSWDVPARSRKKEGSNEKRSSLKQRAHTSAGAGRPTTSAGRPHTSAGRTSGAGVFGTGALLRPGTAHGTPGVGAPYVQGVGTTTDGDRIVSVRLNTITGETTVTAQPAAKRELVRAWEEELARIESTSRRRSEGVMRRVLRIGVGGGP